MKALELAGQQFGRWSVIERASSTAAGGVRWTCRCACGTEKVVVGSELTRGKTVSCGCYRRDRLVVPTPGYNAAHARVSSARGPATAHPCVDCEMPAAEWSYDKTDPDELSTERAGRVVAYSAKPEHYSPRCVPCHRQHDA